VIPSRDERHGSLSVRDEEDGQLLPAQEFLDHHVAPGFSEAASEDLFDGPPSLLERLTDDHALSGCQP
jgi:hypothetical protein